MLLLSVGLEAAPAAVTMTLQPAWGGIAKAGATTEIGYFDQTGRFLDQSLTVEEIEKAEKMCSPQYVPEPWEEWRERLNEWAGGIDTYTEMSKIAREIPAGTLAENVEPRRWWKSETA